jgi:hypothetical protein
MTARSGGLEHFSDEKSDHLLIGIFGDAKSRNGRSGQ